MWPFQVYFGSSLQTTAKSIFKEIGEDLEPTVFMIGLLRDSIMERSGVCFEPEKFDYYGVELFNNFDEVAEGRFRMSKDSQMFYSGPGQQELMTGRHLASHQRMLLESLLDKRSPDNIHYAGESQFVHGYDIYIVVRFDKKAHDTYVHLFRNSLSDDDYGLILTKSLLQATLQGFLKDAVKLLYIPNVGRNLSGDFHSHMDYLRAGARDFMLSIASRGENFDGMHSFYQICESLSLSTYENEIVTGGLLIAPKKHDAVEMLLTLSEEFKFSEHRKTIKLLRLTQDSIYVVTDSESVFGLGKINMATYQPDSEALMIVNFTGFHQWEVTHNSTRLLRMIHGNPQAVDALLTADKLYSDAKRIFSSVEREECESLLKLIEAAIAANSGTQIIISENAVSESERLKARCFKVVPKKLTNDELIRFMRIDGGIMIDQHLNLHAYGVLLDGAVAKKGDSSRGSRYNSALTYYESQEATNPTMIIVNSDDGMISLIPNLRPQVDHKQITKAIEIIRTQEAPENYVHAIFVETQEWLTRHRFYLREEECSQLNDSMKKISEHRMRSGGIFISHGDYVINDDMNDSYYFPGTFSR